MQCLECGLEAKALRAERKAATAVGIHPGWISTEEAPVRLKTRIGVVRISISVPSYVSVVIGTCRGGITECGSYHPIEDSIRGPSRLGSTERTSLIDRCFGDTHDDYLQYTSVSARMAGPIDTESLRFQLRADSLLGVLRLLPGTERVVALVEPREKPHAVAPYMP